MPQSPMRRLIARRSLSVSAALLALCVAAPGVEPSAAAGQSEAPRQKGSGGVSDALLVELRSTVGEAEAASLLSSAGALQIGHFPDARVRVVSAPPGRRASVLAALVADPRVLRVEEDAPVATTKTPNDTFWGRQWGPRLIRAPIAWDAGQGDRSAVIAIVDTGVDRNHPDLRGRVLPGWDFQNDDANPYDDDGHGTAVATTAAGAGNDGRGVAGMCWRCRILPVKVLNGNGRGTHSNIAAGIIWATDRGADVINLSIAGLGSTTALERSIAYAVRKGVIVVAAAGNSGSSRRTYPAAYPGVISVAATNESDRLYGWSNRGPWVTLAAPGCAYSGRPNARWGWLCGTSLSTPMVAGTLGLMKSLAPRLGRSRLTALVASNTQRVRARLSRGRLDAARAIRSVVALIGGSGPGGEPAGTGTYEWRGKLGGDDRWDRKRFELRGNVRISVRWEGARELELYVSNSKGRVVHRRRATGSINLTAELGEGKYAVTVANPRRRQADYRVRIEN